MDKLSKTAEQKLLSAIEATATYVNKGVTPDEAIVKSAADFGIPPGHLDLMVHAYNTGRTTTQRENSNSTLEKSAQFPLADINRVRDTAFNPRQQSTGEIANTSAVSFEYATPPNSILKRAELARAREDLQTRREKMAAAARKCTTCSKETPADAAIQSLNQDVYAEKRAATRVVEEARREATVKYHDVAAAFDELASYFKTAGHTPYVDVLAQASMLHGKDAELVLRKLAGLYPEIEKEASAGNDTVSDTFPHEQVAKILEGIATYNVLTANYYAKQAEVLAPAEAAVKKLTTKQRNVILDTPDDRCDAFTYKISSSTSAPPTPASNSILGATARPGLQYKRGSVPNPPDARRVSDPTVLAMLKKNSETHHALMSETCARFIPLEQQRKLAVDTGMPDGPDLVNFPEDKYTHRVQVKPVLNEGTGLFDPVPEYSYEQMRKEKPEKAKPMEGRKFQSGVTVAGLAGAVLKGTAQGIGAAGDKKDGPKTNEVERVTDPSHETALANIKARGVLNDLALNDEIISAHDADDIAQAFNDISSIAPDMVGNPALMRVMMRKRLEAGSLADFDVKQILEMDKLRAERDATLNRNLESVNRRLG
jgi:hypothetical protein